MVAPGHNNVDNLAFDKEDLDHLVGQKQPLLRRQRSVQLPMIAVAILKCPQIRT